jgi:hypothetical protein
MAAIFPLHQHYLTGSSTYKPRAPAQQPALDAAPPTHTHTHTQSQVAGKPFNSYTAARIPNPAMSGTQAQGSGLRYPSNKKSIYDRNLNRSKNSELSRAAFAYLFIEMIAYAQRGVTNVGDLEQRYVFAALASTLAPQETTHAHDAVD